MPEQTNPQEVLSKTRHFADLPLHIQEEIASHAIRRQYNTGQVVYLQGEPATAIYILEKGWIKAVRMSREGREQAMMFLKPVDIFGDVAVFTNTPYPGTIIALEPVTCWTIERSIILEMVTRYPELAMAVIRKLGERILYYVELVEDLSLRSVEARLAHTLLDHAVKLGDRLVVPRQTWTTYDEMAVRLGTVRDVLSRALSNLEGEGLLQVRRTEIVILEPDRLAARGDS